MSIEQFVICANNVQGDTILTSGNVLALFLTAPHNHGGAYVNLHIISKESAESASTLMLDIS